MSNGIHKTFILISAIFLTTFLALELQCDIPDYETIENPKPTHFEKIHSPLVLKQTLSLDCAEDNF
ncbi:MAG: hypothetical protein GY765_24625, partial [bacterium]|nr:hypothetical protein [bacterium]